MLLLDREGREICHINVPYVEGRGLGDVIRIPERPKPFSVIDLSDAGKDYLEETICFIGVRLEMRHPPDGGRRQLVAVLVSGDEHLSKIVQNQATV